MQCKRIALLGLVAATTAWGFSPYENFLLKEKPTRVGLIVAANSGQETELGSALNALATEKPARDLRKNGITNLSSYKQVFAGKTWFMVYFDYEGENYLEAASDYESIDAVQALNKWVNPHPRAERYGTRWLQMEWITYIRASQEKGTPTDRFAMVTRIKPEKEKEYRTLHQTVWPGVVDQMVRGNYRHFSIFLVEIGDEIYEFFYVEYVGSDAAADAKMNNADPVNQRWWKYTDACQTPLPGASGPWLMMDKVIPEPDAQ